jgi:hypothetical protein
MINKLKNCADSLNLGPEEMEEIAATLFITGLVFALIILIAPEGVT